MKINNTKWHFISILFLIGCSNDKEIRSLKIYDPCNTFVTQFAPSRTPRLENKDGYHMLFVSFTPAKNKEADAIVSSVKKGKTILEINDKKQRFIGQEITKEYDLAIPVKSEDEAKSILAGLCYKEGELVVIN